VCDILAHRNKRETFISHRKHRCFVASPHHGHITRL
jgi:hypothetical protein